MGLCIGLFLSFAATVGSVAIIYELFPRTPPGWRHIFRGALVAAGSIAVLSTGYVAFLRWGVRAGSARRDQVDAFTRARQMTNTWAADPGTTPAPLQEYLASQHKPAEPEA